MADAIEIIPMAEIFQINLYSIFELSISVTYNF